MSDLSKDFEKRFTNEWFSCGWSDTEHKKAEEKPLRKDLATLQAELDEIGEAIDAISQKQLRLQNLAMLYNN